jgi:hypothetical protein
MKRVFGSLFGSAVLVFTGTALAEPTAKNAEWSGDYDVKASRRSDFTAGASLSLLFANAYGYPNEAEKIDNPRYVADTGVAFGTMNQLWIGGALRDWFSFDIGISGLAFQGNKLKATGGAFFFRVETFPMWDAFPAGKDLGLYGEFGLGGLKLERGGSTAADGGAISFIGFGAFFEPLRFSIFSAGPTIEYQHIYSQSLSVYAASAGFRLVLYTGP